ncbi:MAG: TetR/AcrR family transcriptional regulator [Bacteroidales bacterium]|nr:TetR/AcrR family transcriptional regulator [Bacteroidales bacterium]MDD4771250.1 TetR/AcrR family transcriptional regulator [Bacteroidales bacterium]
MHTARQNEIIQKALQLIDSNGIQGLTIKNLSKEIGISEPAIYRHFENKEDIIMSILHMFRQHSEQIMIQVSKKETVSEQMDVLFEQYMHSFQNNPALVAVIFSEELFRNEGAQRELTSAIIAKNMTQVTKMLEKGVQQGTIRNDIPCEHLAYMMLGSLRLFVKNWQLSGFQFPLIEKGRELISSIKTLIVR